MHCCEIARTGQTLPPTLPDEWLSSNIQQPQQRDRIDSSSKSQENANPANLNTTENPSAEQTEAEKKSIQATYEEKRLKNIEVCHFFVLN